MIFVSPAKHLRNLFSLEMISNQSKCVCSRAYHIPTKYKNIQLCLLKHFIFSTSQASTMKIWMLLLLVGAAAAVPLVPQQRERRNVKDVIESLIKDTGMLDLLPWIKEQIKSDPDSQRVIEFFQREQWTNIKNHLKSCPTFGTINAKLQAEGIDLVEILEKAKEFLTGSSRKIQARRPLGEHVNDFIEKLDLEAIMSIIQNKVDSDSGMKKIIEFMESKEAKELEACMRESSDVEDLLEELYNEGIDVPKLVEMFRALFGLSTYYNEARNVQNFVDQFLKEAGILDLLPWVQEKIKSDPDSERVIEFFKSSRWTNIKEHLKKCPGYESMNAKLLAEGIDLVELLEKVKQFVVGPSKFQARRPLGEHLNEFLEKIDLENIMVLVQGKLDTDPNMQKLINFLNSEENKGIETCMKNSDDVKDLIEELYDEGIDVEKLADMFKAMFGVSRYYNQGQGRSIKDMLESLVKETGLDELLSWVQQMIASDPDVKRIVDFFKGDNWKTLKTQLQDCPSYQKIKDKLKEEGIDVNEILDGVKNFVTGGNSLRFSSRRSLGELLNEVLGKLDIDTIMVTITDKLEKDPDMNKLVSFLEGDDFKAIVQCMRQSLQVQHLIAKLKDDGIDVIRLVHVLKAIFGDD